MHMAMDNVARIIVVMQEAQKNNIDLHAGLYFDTTFKTHFKQLEKSIHNQWRLHKSYFEAQSQLCLVTNDATEAKEIVAVMLKTISGKTCSLPVKRHICEKLALMLSTRQNYHVRILIHKTMVTTLAASRSSQHR